jgi:hypothetical protein
MLEEAGDLVASGNWNLTGVQGGATVAKGERLALRGDLQIDALSGPYVLGSAGVGTYVARPKGFRMGLWLDAGTGYARSIDTQTVGGTSVTTHLQGGLGQAVGSIELGWEGPGFATGIELRSANQWVLHSAKSEEQGMSFMTSAEVLALLRIGPGPVKFQGHAGASLPLYIQGNLGLQLPVWFGLGLVWEPEREEVRP